MSREAKPADTCHGPEAQRQHRRHDPKVAVGGRGRVTSERPGIDASAWNALFSADPDLARPSSYAYGHRSPGVAWRRAAISAPGCRADRRLGERDISHPGPLSSRREPPGPAGKRSRSCRKCHDLASGVAGARLRSGLVGRRYFRYRGRGKWVAAGAGLGGNGLSADGFSRRYP